MPRANSDAHGLATWFEGSLPPRNPGLFVVPFFKFSVPNGLTWPDITFGPPHSDQCINGIE